MLSVLERIREILGVAGFDPGAPEIERFVQELEEEWGSVLDDHQFIMDMNPTDLVRHFEKYLEETGGIE